MVLAGLLTVGCGAPKKQITADPAVFVTVGNSFLQTLMHGQYQSAYDRFISPGAKYNPGFSLQQFIADWQAITEKYGPIKKAVIAQTQAVPGRKIVQLYYQVTHEKAGETEYHLVGEMDPAGRCTFFLIDLGNVEKYPRQGEGGEKKKAASPAVVVP
jgi:hypothetical protein